MKINDDKWLESLRDAVDGCEVKPRTDLWQRIEADLPKPQQRRVLTVVWRAVAVAACLAVVVGAYFLMSRTGGNVAVQPSSPLTAKASSPASDAESEPESPLIACAGDAESLTPSAAKQPAVLAASELAESPVLISVDEEPECEAAPSDSIPQKKQSGTVREFLDAKPTTPDGTSKQTPRQRTSSKAADTDGRFQVALSANTAFGQGSSSSTNGFAALRGQNNYLFAADGSDFGNTYLEAAANNIDEPTSTSEVVSFPVSYSASFRYMITERWGINAGVSYTSATSECRSGSAVDYYSSKVRMHYVGVPVTVSYNFLNSRYVTIYGLAGGTVEKCVASTKKETVVASGIEQKSASRKSNLNNRPWQGSLNAGAGVQFNITDRYGIFAEPQVVYDLSDDSNSPARRRNDWSFQLAVGLRLSY